MIEAGAVLSPCRRWRTRLTRRWALGPALLVIGLNPSTADERQDDPTIRRCAGYARSWGFPALEVQNLYAWRSTRPGPLWDGSVPDPVGPETDAALLEGAAAAGLVLAAWGAFPKARERAAAVVAALRARGLALHVLGLTREGWPRHPLYARAALRPTRWEGGPAG